MSHHPILAARSRRDFLRFSGCGFGSMALAAMCAGNTLPKESPLAPKQPHFAPRAKRVIFLWMQGGPSHMDLFDYKPRLQKEGGNKFPIPLPKNYEAPGIGRNLLMAPISTFSHQGKAGIQMSDMLPNLGKVSHELCILNGMQADSEAHAPAVRQLHTGHTVMVRPSMGSWVTYGLGTENQNLPGFVTICPQVSGDGGSTQLFSNAFLPAIYQGTPIGEAGNAKDAQIRYLQDKNISQTLQRREIDLIQSMNKSFLKDLETDQNMEGMIESFEIAFRMQAKAPALLDLTKETPATLALYGVGEKETDNFGRQCLLARRMVEAGVRFVQITDGGWDHHAKIRSGLPERCKAIDKPVAALLTDLRARGLMDDTLLIWSGEFGRTPFEQDLSEGKAPAADRGREHNPKGFTAWMAGAGVRGGMVYGQTDEFGWEAVDGKMHIHDLHATALHLLGIDHERLTHRYMGRDFRLTDVYGTVVKEILS
jgi:hypothetical protein